jgi:hypothetical protein
MAAPARRPWPGGLRCRRWHVRGTEWFGPLRCRHLDEFTDLRPRPKQRRWVRAPYAERVRIDGPLSEPAAQLSDHAGVREDPEAERPLLDSAEFEDQLAYLDVHIVAASDQYDDAHDQLDFTLAIALPQHQPDAGCG